VSAIPHRARAHLSTHRAALVRQPFNLAAHPWATYLKMAIRERHDLVLCSRQVGPGCLEVFRHRSAKSIQRSPGLSHCTRWARIDAIA
jgi:hypothetical protein